MKNKILLITIILLTNIALGDVFQHKADINSFINDIPELNSISCKFKQEKTIKGINKPLLSGGNFKFKKNEGVYFETIYPVKSTTSYTTKEFSQINSIIKAISNKKYKNIEKEFDFYFEKEKSNWILGLKPKSTNPASKYILSIEIAGVDFINKITIKTNDGNKTQQWFFK